MAGFALVLLYYYWTMEAEQFEVLLLLISSVMPLAILTVVVLAVILLGITTATIGGGWRGGRVPARIPGADARLETHQPGRISHRENHIDGVLAVRRFGTVLGGVCDFGRSGAAGELGAFPQSDAGPVHDPVAGDHLHPGLAAGVDRDHRRSSCRSFCRC